MPARPQHARQRGQPQRGQPQRSQRQRGQSQRPLNRDVILEGAIALIEREGPGALSMRRLGSTLGVEAMAIYHHFAGRAASRTWWLTDSISLP